MSLSDQMWGPTSVQVTVLQARGLRIKGKSGTNDAYAVMQVGKDRFQTSVAEKSVAPVWKEEASFDMPSAQQGGTLHVHVLHRALVGPDKLLGQAVISLFNLSEDKSRDKAQWFKLLDKAGKPDKDRGEVLVDIQFMRNNMTASMFDVSAAGKSRSRLGKFKDKVRGKKKDGLSETASNVVPTFSQVLTDSEGDGNSDNEGAAAKDEKKKNKVKSLFSHKSNLHKSLSQSMSVLPGRNSSLSGSVSSGLNVEQSEGKKKFKFLSHKRTGSSDKKDGLQKLGAEQSNLCINGSHIYCEEPAPRTSRTSSNFSISSSGVGSMEDVPDSSPPSVGSGRSARHNSPWTEEEEEETLEESTQEVNEEMFRRQELEKLAEEESRIEEEQRRLEEVRKREEEEERRREEVLRLEQERLQKEMEEKEAAEMLRVEEERKQKEKLQEAEEERRRIEEEDQRRREEEERQDRERIREEEERMRLEKQKRREEEQRKAQEVERRQEEERRADEARRHEERLLEDQKKKQEERERLRKEEEERLRMEMERAEEERRIEEERKRLVVEKKQREEEVKKAQEEEKRRLKREEEKRQSEEEERVKKEREEERRQRELEEEQERIRIQEEKQKMREKERAKEEERKKREEERMRQEQEEYERQKQEKEEQRRQMEQEEERRRLEEEEEQRRWIEKKRKEDEAEEMERLTKEKRGLEEEDRLMMEEAQRSNNTTLVTHDVTNPFDEDDVTSARQRCKLLLERNTCSFSEKDLSTTQQEKRQAPKPPRMNSSERQQVSQHEIKMNKPSKDKEIKTASVLPQRAVQRIPPVSTPLSDINNLTSKQPEPHAASSGRTAQQRPGPVEGGVSSKVDISHGHLPKSGQAGAVGSLNPFEEDEDVDELVDQHTTTSLPQSVEKDTTSQMKIKSSKTAPAPAPPAKKPHTASTDNGHDTGVTISEISDDKAPAPVQKTLHKESKCAQDAPPVPSRRLLPVRPLNPLDQQPVSVVQVERENKSTGELIRGQEKKAKASDSGPYSLLTQEELISLVQKQKKQLLEKEKKISELEQYIDNLLVRVIEEAPNVLMTMASLPSLK